MTPPPNRRRAAKGGQHALSIEQVYESSVVAPLPESIDVDGLAGQLGFDEEESDFFAATVLDSLSWVKATKFLGWSRQRGERVRKRVARRLKRYRKAPTFDIGQYVRKGSSSHLAFLERLPSGRFCWALAELGTDFLDVMNREHAKAFGRACAEQKKPMSPEC